MAEFTKPVTLHSPPEKSARVKDAQYLMSGNNVYKIHTYHGKLDSVYGAVSGAATMMAKTQLGYPRAGVDRRFGQQLYEYLNNKRPLTDDMKNRRAAWVASHAVPIRTLALRVASAEVGYKENPPDSNMTKYGRWYGMNGVAWCAIFASWCYSQAGSKFKQSYVPTIYDLARNGLMGLSLVNPTTVQPGDLACFDWDANDILAHVELFHSWVSKGQSFNSVGGNTGSTNFSNGGEVMKSVRNMSNVHNSMFVRVSK